MIRPFVPVGLLDLMARRAYTDELQRTAAAALIENRDRSVSPGKSDPERRRTALILFWWHELGTVQSLAVFLRDALVALQVDVTLVDVASQDRLDELASQGIHYDFAISIGSLSLAKRALGKPVYEIFGDKFYFWVLDIVLYDLLNVWQTPQYIRAAQQSTRLRFLVLDRDYASLLEAMTSPLQTQYFPFGGNYGPLPPARSSDARQKRLLVIGTIGSDLTHVSDSGLEQLADYGDTPRMSPAQRSRFFEAIEAPGAKTNTTMVAKDVFGLDAGVLLSPEWLPLLTRVDAYQKRRRRLLVAEAVRGLPVDFYGTGWEARVNGCDSFRFYGPVAYTAASALFSSYPALVNFNPNLDYGLNDRVTTALGYGCRVITDANLAMAEISAPDGSVYSYDANNSDLVEHAAAAFAAPQVANEQVLAFRNQNSWGAIVDRFLQTTA